MEARSLRARFERVLEVGVPGDAVAWVGLAGSHSRSQYVSHLLPTAICTLKRARTAAALPAGPVVCPRNQPTLQPCLCGFDGAQSAASPLLML